MVESAIVPVGFNAEHAIKQVKEMQRAVLHLKDNVFVDGHDYGVIPGTGEKPTLLLPGMQKLTRALNAVPKFIDLCVIRDYDKPLFHFEFECELVDVETGGLISGGRGRGLCTSEESAFKWRWVFEEDLPPNLDKTNLRVRRSTKKEMAFAVDKGETGGKYGKPPEYWQEFRDAIASGKAKAVKIPSSKDKTVSWDGWLIETVQYRIPNPEIADQLNTILKRAKKRALGDAITGAANVSAFFSVDLEDSPMAEEIRVEKHYEPPPPHHDDVEDGEIVEDAHHWATQETIKNVGKWVRAKTGQVTLTGPQIAELLKIDDFANLDAYKQFATPDAAVEQAVTNWQKQNVHKWANENTIKALIESVRKMLILEMTESEIARLGSVANIKDFAAWNEQYATLTDALQAINNAFNAPPSTKTPVAPDAPTKPEESASETFTAVVESAQYIKKGKEAGSMYLLFKPTKDGKVIEVRCYGRTTTFKEWVGEEYFKANGFDGIDKKAGQPHIIQPLEISYQETTSKDGSVKYFTTIGAKPVIVEEQQYGTPLPEDIGDIPF